MSDTLDDRVSNLEIMMSELPQIMNLRQERLENHMRDNAARFDEMGGRLNLLDRQMGMLVRDVRDLRGGVTRQLIAQDERISELKTDVTELKAGVTELKAGVTELKADVTELKADVTELKSGVTDLKTGVALILARLPPV